MTISLEKRKDLITTTTTVSSAIEISEIFANHVPFKIKYDESNTK